MDPRKSTRRSRRRFAPRWEGLEIRELPSTTALLATGALLGTTRAAGGGGGTGSSSSSPSIPLLFRPFTARFQGPLVVGAPRAADQRSQTYLFGGGNSSAFL